MFNNEAYQQKTNAILNKIEINYCKILDDNMFLHFHKDEEFDFDFIVPVRGREDFLSPLYNSFLKAQEKTELKANFTVVEYSHMPDHVKFCKKNKINYIWIHCTDTTQFNKCLCYNMGALFSTKSKYVVCHDLDCLVPSKFFVKLMKNITNKKAKAIQSFQKRRVLYCSEDLTRQIIIDKNIDVDTLSLKLEDISEPGLFGAPGGSITIERGLFFEVGGYDDDIFIGYAPEDAFFWDKIKVVTKVYTCNKPSMDIFHMWHPPSHDGNPFLEVLTEFYQCFKGMSKENKEKVLKNRSEKLKKYARL